MNDKKEDKECINTLIREKNVRFFAMLESLTSLSEGVKRVDITYAHAADLTQIWEKKGFVAREKSGRVIRFVFTDKGRKLAELCNSMLMV